jgi:hypothetical protein
MHQSGDTPTPAPAAPDPTPAPTLTPEPAEAPPSSTVPMPPTAGRRCENCGTVMLGDHCYACGQPTRGMVRHFGTIVGDLVDTVFNFDSRTLRTLGPLLFRPGRLTQEYFEGHRVRFVSPVRLFFFFCVAAFLALQFSVDTENGFQFDSDSRIARAQTVAEVEQLRDTQVKELEEARAEIPDAPGARVGMDVGIDRVRANADERIEWLGKRDAAIAAGKAPPPFEGEERNSNFQFNDKDWHPVDNPVVVGWLPDAGNRGLNKLIGRAKDNLAQIQDEPARLIDAFLQTLPQTLFVLLPVFALLLKIVYLFKRRLYMEHLIVALHSHAFLCAALLLIVGLTDLGALFEPEGFFAQALELGVFVLMCWMPIYLLIMQKRVYRQGWIMTLLKYFVLGNCYLVLISLGVLVNLAFSLVAM